VLASETDCARDEARGFVYPNPRYVYANNWLQATYYGVMLNYLRELSGAGLLQVPSSHLDWANAETARDLNRFIRSPAMSSLDRVKLFKLAWDIVGSEFAGRHAQYELFYAGGRAQTTSVRAYRAFDFEAAKRRVDECLAGYGLPDTTPARPR
jgi:4-hydroxyphenylacetate 3-monooxygenase